MYSSYSPLQRTQLSGQVYTDTQSLYLLVYAPGRRVALENTLRDQLHQKFRLVSWPWWSCAAGAWACRSCAWPVCCWCGRMWS